MGGVQLSSKENYYYVIRDTYIILNKVGKGIRIITCESNVKIKNDHVTILFTETLKGDDNYEKKDILSKSLHPDDRVYK